MKLQVRHALGDIREFAEPADAVVQAVDIALRELAKVGPAWDTLSITVKLDDTFVDHHVITVNALEA